MCDAGRVRFNFEQRWDATPDEVIEVYLDESFWAGLTDLSTTAPPTVLDIVRKGNRATVRLHWVLSVDLPAEAARFINPDDVAWVEQTDWDLAKRNAAVSFHPDQAAGLLHASATADLTGDSTTTRTVNGELKVRIPLLGRKVEPVIVDGVKDHLAEETTSVAARLAG